MGRILIHLIDDVELILINIFQTGIKAVSDEMRLEVEHLAEKCQIYSLDCVGKELQTLYKYLTESKYETDFDYDKITRSVSTLSQSVMILKNKINYDLAGGY